MYIVKSIDANIRLKMNTFFSCFGITTWRQKRFINKYPIELQETCIKLTESTKKGVKFRIKNVFSRPAKSEAVPSETSPIPK
ncbi:MAG: hypothetical protein HWN67_05790 [Candidatus Helarchaeota archaeon]|nr:hypothetical protein [Candidatus Helarchaeota archaeon]